MAQGTWELRVHGVAGTPPAAMLQLEEVRVPDAWEGVSNGDDRDDLEVFEMPARVAERRAFSWSSLTSGKAKHALYVLLLPFMLSNVAGWMLPGLEASEHRALSLRRRVIVVRLAALCVTVQFATLLAVTVLDVVGRQWLVRRAAEDWKPWAAAGTVLLCGVVVALLASLTRVRPLRKESEQDPELRDRVGSASMLVNQPALWETPALARFLHHVHVAVLMGALAGLVAGSAWRARMQCSAAEASAACEFSHISAEYAGLIALWIAALTMVVSVVAVCTLSGSRTGTLPKGLLTAVRVAPWAAAAALGGGTWAWAGSPAPYQEVVTPIVRGGLVITMVVLLLILCFALPKAWRAASLVVLAAGVGALYGAGVASTLRAAIGDGVELPSSFGWLALGFVVAQVLLVLLATWRYHRLYGRSRDPNRRWVAVRAFAGEPGRIIAAVGSIGALCAGGLICAFAVFQLSSAEGADGALLNWRNLPGVDQAWDRMDDVAWTLLAASLACVTSVAVRVSTGAVRGAAAVSMGVAVLAAVARWVLRPKAMSPAALDAAPWLIVLVTMAALILLTAWAVWQVRRSQGEGSPPVDSAVLAVVITAVAGAGLLVWLQRSTLEAEDILVTTALTLPVGLVLTRLRGALGDRSARKGLAVLWDLGTFWPRWFHPFSPPTYSDRAVDGLSSLLRQQLPQRPILLAPHSQGSVIAVAAILHAEQATRGTSPSPLRRLSLLTYGSPVGHHYRVLFPAMFSEAALRSVAEALRAGTLRWRNLWRASDPIAGKIGIDPLIDELSGPAGLADPELRKHSAYWLEEQWGTARDVLLPPIEGG